ncbi:glutathione S-transferase family protein [Colwellia sp. TT2012]|uniref:glutathione S-transferase family protein n=1 Tax=Colwellia sp. TT2012 TaxID=1720342 RepID=UPI00070C3DCC|nr:glutathione S-transferase family protein [Colwellia sp. TT2012]
MYKLYYYPNNASLAPHFLLHEMNLEYELQLVDRKSNTQKSTEYLKLNPAGRIPTLIDGSLVLFESPAICIHLCEQNPSKKLIPPVGSVDRAKFFQWLTFLNNTLQAELMVYYYPQKHTTDESCIPSIIKAQEERISEALLILDNQLKGKNFLLGNDISACDFFLFMLAEWSLKIEKSPLSFPSLGSYLRKLAKHATIREVCKKENIRP